MLVVGARDVGDHDIQVALAIPVAAKPLGLASDAVDTARPLLQRRWIPGEVVVNHVAALPVQVDALLALWSFVRRGFLPRGGSLIPA